MTPLMVRDTNDGARGDGVCDGCGGCGGCGGGGCGGGGRGGVMWCV